MIFTNIFFGISNIANINDFLYYHKLLANTRMDSEIFNVASQSSASKCDMAMEENISFEKVK